MAPHHSDGGVAVALVAVRAAQRQLRTEGLPPERRLARRLRLAPALGLNIRYSLFCGILLT
jgi:hypothetical protein